MIVFVDLVCVSLGLLHCWGFFLPALILIFSVLAERLGGRSIREMTNLVSSGTLNVNSVNQLFFEGTWSN